MNHSENIQNSVRRQQTTFIWVILLGAVLVYIVGKTILAWGYTPPHLIVYAFSTQEEVLNQGILPAFKDAWEQKNGQELKIEAVFGPSDTLAAHINLGAPADVALFSNERHVKWLKIGRKISSETQPIIISYTPIVIVTRPGNPYNIHDYADLGQPGLRLLHADPRSSGAAQWSLLAEYGSALLESQDPEIAKAQLLAIWDNVKVLGASARATLTLFELGAGDALITYEQDARLAQERGVPLEIIPPPRTIIAQHIVVAVDDHITRSERPIIQAFLDYLVSPEGQEIFKRYHLRPENLPTDEFPPLSEAFTVNDLGGWFSAYNQTVEPLWQTKIEPDLNLDPAPVPVYTGY